MKWSDIETAFEFVNSAPYGENRAYLCPTTGRVVWNSDFMDSLEEEEESDVLLEEGNWIEVPHKNDLGIGRELVFRFAARNLSAADYARIERIFSHRGAYGNFKDLLCERKLLQAWYDYSSQAEEKALEQWAAEQNIPIEK